MGTESAASAGQLDTLRNRRADASLSELSSKLPRNAGQPRSRAGNCGSQRGRRRAESPGRLLPPCFNLLAPEPYTKINCGYVPTHRLT